MYVPARYNETRLDRLHAIMRRHSFAVLVTHGRSGLLATHIPILLDAARGERGTLTGHLSLGNPQWRDVDEGAEVLVVFSGPHAYISPRWYHDHPSVPTWDYAAVHAYGPWQPIDDPAVTMRVLQQTVDVYESALGEPWTLDRLSREEVDTDARGVKAFEIPIARLEGTWKFSQNKPGDLARIAEGLERTGDPEAAAVARIVRGELP